MNESQSGEKTPQETPGNQTEAPKEAPVYTETQWRERQSNIRKELQPLKDKIAKLEADNLALASQNEEYQTNSKLLADKVAQLTREIDEGIPAEAKDVVSRYNDRYNKLSQWEAGVRKDIAKHDEIIAEAMQIKLEREADRLSSKFGIDKETLLGLKDVGKMQAYAVENFDPAKFAAPPEPVPRPELPKPEPPANMGGLSKEEFLKQFASGQSDDYNRYREVSGI